MKVDMWADITRNAYLDSLDFEKKPGFATIAELGFEYTGAHGRGGGMGYDIWHEFYHPKYGTLCFLAHDVGNPLFGFEGDWYLIPSGCSEFGFHEIHRPVSGLDLTELLEYVKEVDNEQVSSEI